MSWADATWGTTAWATDAGAPAPTPTAVITRKPLTVHATIDGRAVLLDEWTADATINHGYRTLTGRVPLEVTWAEQEAPITLWTSDDEELWSGTLAQDPRAAQGVRHIRAEGPAAAISASQTRLLYRRDGFEGWVNSEDDPHEYANSEKFDIELAPGAAKWRFGDATTNFVAGSGAGILVWTEGADITRYEFKVVTTLNAPSFDIRTNRATGPSGTLTQVADHSLDITDAQTYIRNIGAFADLLDVRIRANTSTTPGLRRRVRLYNMKLYGRTTDDGFSASEVVADVGADAGFNTALVEANPLQVLPLDWTDDHAALLSYMAELTDWRWLVRGPASLGGPPSLEFGPWNETWTAFLSHDATGELEPLKRFNRVWWPYRTTSGELRYAKASATEDPFPGREVIWYEDELEEQHQIGDLAEAAAQARVDYLASRRVAGNLAFGQVKDPNGEYRSPYKIRPGVLLALPDTDYPPQRVAAVTYRKDADVTAEISEDSSVVRLLSNLRAEQRRPKKKGKKG